MTNQSSLLETFVWSTGVNAVLAGLLGLLVGFSRPRSRAKDFWILASISVSGWSLGLNRMTATSDALYALRWSQILTAAAALIPVFLYFSVLEILDIKANAAHIAGLIISTIVVLSLDITGQLLSVQSTGPFPFFTLAKPAYGVFALHLYGAFAVVIGILAKAFVKSQEPKRRKQIRVLLLAIGLGFIGGQTTVPMVYRLDFFPFGILFVPIFVIASGYGFLRHQLLDLKLVLRKTTIFLSIYALSAVVALPIIWPTFHLLRNLEESTQFQFGFACLAISVFLASAPSIYAVLITKNQTIRMFLSTGLSHDIRSPLASIQSATEILNQLMSSPNENAEKIQAYIRMIEGNAERLSNFSSGLVEWIKQSDGITETELQPVNVFEVFSEAVTCLSPVLTQNRISVAADIDERLFVFGRQEGLRSILQNLISNSIRHSPNGEIRFVAIREGHLAVCRLTDSGEGLEPGQDDLLFSQRSPRSQVDGRLGLGLTIAKGWVESFGGRIWATSDGKGRGLSINFELRAIGARTNS